MQIESTAGTGVLFVKPGSTGLASGGLDFQGMVLGSGGDAAANPTTAAMPYLLAAGTAAQVMAAAQQATGTDPTGSGDPTATADSAASTAASDSTAAGADLPIGVQHWMQDIANDPTFAAQQASEWANSQPVVCFNLADLPKNGAPASVWMAFNDKMNAEMKVAEQVQQQLKALYQTETAKGVAPAQIYADMLNLKASQPQSYLDTQGFAGENVKSLLTSQMAFLQQAIDGAAAA